MSTQWKLRGSCNSHKELDFVEPADKAAAAECLQICAGCPVRDLCLTEAMKAGEEGIWGGTTDAQRKALAARNGIEIPRQIEIQHGTRATYTRHGCHCDDCKAAHRRWTQDYRARKRRPDPYSTPIVLLRRRGKAQPGQYLLPLQLPTAQGELTEELAA